MALPPDLSAATRVLAKTPIHDLPCMKVIQVWAAACFDFQVSKLIPYMRRTARSRKTMGERISITRDILPCSAWPFTRAEGGLIYRVRRGRRR